MTSGDQYGAHNPASWLCVYFARAGFIGAVLTIEILPQGSKWLPARNSSKILPPLSLNHPLGAKTKVLVASVLLPQAMTVQTHVVWGDPCVGYGLPDSLAQ